MHRKDGDIMTILKITKVKIFLVGIMMMATILDGCSSQVQPSKPAQDGDYYYSVTARETQITKYKGAGGVVTIPSALAGFPVTSIGDSAFSQCTNLTSISLPQGVKSIGDGAFIDCTGLTSIRLPQGVTSIGDGAFGCTGLTSISIPQGVTSIGIAAFYSCKGLTTISIPQGVTSIGKEAFFNCTYLTSINLPQGVTSIGENAFTSCTDLTSISIPQGVTSIGKEAFYGCDRLATIRFNSATTTIDAISVIPCTTKIIGYASSTAKTYAAKYNIKFEVIGTDIVSTP